MRGIAKMVAEDRYRLDVATQITAVRAALRRAEGGVLRGHVTRCAEQAIACSDPAERRRKVQELVELLARAGLSQALGSRRAIHPVVMRHHLLHGSAGNALL